MNRRVEIVITDLDSIVDAVEGRAGTVVLPD